MFFHCTKYHFKLERPQMASGGIISASGIPSVQILQRNKKVLLSKTYPHLAHRYLDPQLYLGRLPRTSKAVVNLATYPWFGVANQPFHSSQLTFKEWKQANKNDLINNWTGTVPTNDNDILQAVLSCIGFQLTMGVDGIILPSPLTNTLAGNYDLEGKYLDAAEEACKRLAVTIPVFASVAFSDQLVRGTDPIANSLLSTITAQIAARSFVNGAYLVVEQPENSGHCYNCEEGCLSLLMLTDDLSRGARKTIICNYAGTFGAITMAAGTSIWASGHYLSQRRLVLGDSDGRAYPRFYSKGMLGDVGVEKNVQVVHSGALRGAILDKTIDSTPLLAALASGSSVDLVPAWRYRQGNVSAGAGHYYELCKSIDDTISQYTPASRVDAVEKLLEHAVKLSGSVSRDRNIEKGKHTDIDHQQVWLNAFKKWRGYSGL